MTRRFPPGLNRAGGRSCEIWQSGQVRKRSETISGSGSNSRMTAISRTSAPAKGSYASAANDRLVRIAVTQPPAWLTTGCLLDPCGLAYSLLRPPASTPKVVPTRGWTTGLPPQAIATRRAKTGPLDRLLRPREGWLGTRQTAREKPQRRGRGPGSGRRPVQPAEAWSAIPAKGRDAARTIF